MCAITLKVLGGHAFGPDRDAMGMSRTPKAYNVCIMGHRLSLYEIYENPEYLIIKRTI